MIAEPFRAFAGSLRIGLVLALVLTACGSDTSASRSPASSAAAVSSSSSYPTVTSSAKGLCANPYLPADKGNQWKYKVSSNLQVPKSYTDEVTRVDAHGFEITSGEKVQRWRCAPEGLIALAYGFGPTSALKMVGVADGYETTDVQGVSIPDDLHVGSQWDQTFTLRSSGGGEGTVEIASDTVNEDAVALADAVFKTLRIESAIKIHLVDGDKTVDSSFTMFQWYDDGGGLFEILAFGSYGGENLMVTIKLDSFDVAGFK